MCARQFSSEGTQSTPACVLCLIEFAHASCIACALTCPCSIGISSVQDNAGEGLLPYLLQHEKIKHNATLGDAANNKFLQATLAPAEQRLTARQALAHELVDEGSVSDPKYQLALIDQAHADSRALQQGGEVGARRFEELWAEVRAVGRGRELPWPDELPYKKQQQLS